MCQGLFWGPEHEWEGKSKSLELVQKRWRWSYNQILRAEHDEVPDRDEHWVLLETSRGWLARPHLEKDKGEVRNFSLTMSNIALLIWTVTNSHLCWVDTSVISYVNSNVAGCWSPSEMARYSGALAYSCEQFQQKPQKEPRKHWRNA